ncbi:MAG TPA: hypothetical protein VLG28_10495 [Acidimicrobiia bacterium]|jgi:hypothetical protein|nr:hypothetical protein [Acidimicrobiia bacterium]
MQGIPTLDLAAALGTAHREELTMALRTRPDPSHTWRATLGRSLVRAGNRLLDHSDRPTSSASAVAA